MWIIHKGIWEGMKEKYSTERPTTKLSTMYTIQLVGVVFLRWESSILNIYSSAAFQSRRYRAMFGNSPTDTYTWCYYLLQDRSNVTRPEQYLWSQNILKNYGTEKTSAFFAGRIKLFSEWVWILVKTMSILGSVSSPFYLIFWLCCIVS